MAVTHTIKSIGDVISVFAHNHLDKSCDMTLCGRQTSLLFICNRKLLVLKATIVCYALCTVFFKCITTVAIDHCILMMMMMMIEDGKERLFTTNLTVSTTNN